MGEIIPIIIGIGLILFLGYLVLAIPYAYIKPLYLKLTKGKKFANKIIKQNLALKKYLNKHNKKFTKTTLITAIKKNFEIDDNFKGLFGVKFCFKNLKDFTYTFHIKKNDILIVCSSFNDFYGYTIEFFANGKNFEVRQEDIKNTTDYLLSSATKHKHWGVRGKLSFTAKSYANNLLKDKNYKLNL